MRPFLPLLLALTLFSASASAQQAPSRAELERAYPWLSTVSAESTGELTTLERRFAPPAGFVREEAPAGSYAAYLRGLPLRTDRTDVRLYNGEPASMPSAAIVPIDLGSRDLHQCADSVIRMYADWLWTRKQADQASFHFTSGDLARWADWRAGKVLRVRGNKVVQVSAKRAPNTYSAYRSWLNTVFNYASTRSMHRDATRVTRSADLKPGDFFLQGGSPGHVVMLLDIAAHPDGRRIALIGQGFLPAREFSVIKTRGDRVLENVWFILPDQAGSSIPAPPWYNAFSMEDAWRFK
jgi:hypothetical protein